MTQKSAQLNLNSEMLKYCDVFMIIFLKEVFSTCELVSEIFWCRLEINEREYDIVSC